jgi:transcriptional regulator with XRE-family HTH domain
MPKKSSKPAKKSKINPLEVQESEIESILIKLEYFRGEILKLSQTNIADHTVLSQSIIHRMEKGKGSIPNLIKVLLYYHRVQGLDLDSLFDFKQEIKFDTSLVVALKKLDYNSETDTFFNKLEHFRKGVIGITQLKVSIDLKPNFTPNIIHRLEKGSGSISAFLKLLVYYQRVHALNVNTAFNKNVDVTVDTKRLSDYDPF